MAPTLKKVKMHIQHQIEEARIWLSNERRNETESLTKAAGQTAKLFEQHFKKLKEDFETNESEYNTFRIKAKDLAKEIKFALHQQPSDLNKRDVSALKKLNDSLIDLVHQTKEFNRNFVHQDHKPVLTPQKSLSLPTSSRGKGHERFGNAFHARRNIGKQGKGKG